MMAARRASWSCGAPWRPGRTRWRPGPRVRAWRVRSSPWTSWRRRRPMARVRHFFFFLWRGEGWMERGARALTPATSISLSLSSLRHRGSTPRAHRRSCQAARRAGCRQVRLIFFFSFLGQRGVGQIRSRLPFLHPPSPHHTVFFSKRTFTDCSRGRPRMTWASNSSEAGDRGQGGWWEGGRDGESYVV